jgi:hypothetical protein
MCGENKACLVIFLVMLLFCCVWGVAHPGEQWYLITEGEVRSIEEYKKNSEAERQTWLLQVQGLRTRAESLEAESASLNGQLLGQREANRRLTQSFNEYEAEQSRLMSRKDTRIIKLEADNEGKDSLIVRLIIAVAALGLVVIGSIAFKVCRFLKIIPM